MSEAAALEIRQPGLLATVQDLGRFGYQDLGMPVAGALDPLALRVANALVGNGQGEAALEMGLMGPEFRVAAESCRVAFCGPVRPTLAGEPPRQLEPWRSYRLVRDQVVRVGAVTGASVAYLAVEGGFAVPPFMGSRSTYLRAGLGGFEGRALRAGDRLPLRREAAGDRKEMAVGGPPDYGSGPVRVVPGPQDDHFTGAAVETFLSSEYVVSKDADRMGLRLEGPKLEHRDGWDIVSDGIVTGSVQVPGSGLPIVLLVDHQTAGGYTKIATVISADLPRVGRMLPGQRLAFRAVVVEEAEALRREQELAVERLIRAMAPAGAAAPDSRALASENLISGVVDALET
ncbi:MAG TPA: biotin-dependent carboxyltransferase family protein [Geminicoccaceae bacterium]|nr:biotin-dependent carboxyltransferase family protein [Geminicoccaceae bacterium]